MIYSETYPAICADKRLHILQDIYSPILIFITETILMLILSLVINLVRHSKQHKLNIYQQFSIVVPIMALW